MTIILLLTMNSGQYIDISHIFLWPNSILVLNSGIYIIELLNREGIFKTKVIKQ